MSDDIEQTIAGLTVRLDRDGCISTGACVKAAPGVLRLDSRQLVTFAEPIAEIDRERLVDACRSCPVGAIEAFDRAGERLAP